MSMCWCKDCKWYCQGMCTNDKSINFQDCPNDYNSCEHSELKKRNFLEESMRGAVKTLKELYMLAENMENYSASYALAEGIVALEDKIESKEKENDNE